MFKIKRDLKKFIHILIEVVYGLKHEVESKYNVQYVV
jgi:hypothetical protein